MICVRKGYKKSSFVIIVCHHSAILVMPIGDPRDRLRTNGDHEGRIVLYHPHTHDRFLLSKVLQCFWSGNLGDSITKKQTTDIQPG